MRPPKSADARGASSSGLRAVVPSRRAPPLRSGRAHAAVSPGRAGGWSPGPSCRPRARRAPGVCGPRPGPGPGEALPRGPGLRRRGIGAAHAPRRPRRAPEAAAVEPRPRGRDASPSLPRAPPARTSTSGAEGGFCGFSASASRPLKLQLRCLLRGSQVPVLLKGHLFFSTRGSHWKSGSSRAGARGRALCLETVFHDAILPVATRGRLQKRKQRAGPLRSPARARARPHTSTGVHARALTSACTHTNLHARALTAE